MIQLMRLENLPNSHHRKMVPIGKNFRQCHMFCGLQKSGKHPSTTVRYFPQKWYSWSVSRVLYSTYGVLTIYLRRVSPRGFIVLPSNSDGPPLCAGLHELSASEVHSTHCHQTTGGLLLHLLTLTQWAPSLDGTNRAVIFFCTDQPSRTTSRQEADCPMLPGLSSHAPINERTSGEPTDCHSCLDNMSSAAKIRVIHRRTNVLSAKSTDQCM